MILPLYVFSQCRKISQLQKNITNLFRNTIPNHIKNNENIAHMVIFYGSYVQFFFVHSCSLFFDFILPLHIPSRSLQSPLFHTLASLFSIVYAYVSPIFFSFLAFPYFFTALSPEPRWPTSRGLRAARCPSLPSIPGARYAVDWRLHTHTQWNTESLSEFRPNYGHTVGHPFWMRYRRNASFPLFPRLPNRFSSRRVGPAHSVQPAAQTPRISDSSPPGCGSFLDRFISVRQRLVHT